jgi:hypothetical protein
MCKYFYANVKPKPNGDIEIHTQSCNRLPNFKNRILLGIFNNSFDAIRKAKERFSTAIGCLYCCNECNHDDENTT